MKKPKSYSWSPAPPLPGHKKNISSTLFSKEYLIVIADESQDLRTKSARHCAAVALLAKALVRLPCTATPLQTSAQVSHSVLSKRSYSSKAVQDLSAMGRLVGLWYFFSDSHLADEKEDKKDLRRASAEKADNPTVDKDQCPVSNCQDQISHRMYGAFDGRVIRRSADSKKPDGSPLIDLPPLTTLHCFVQLTERELNIIEELTEPDLNV